MFHEYNSKMTKDGYRLLKNQFLTFKKERLEILKEEIKQSRQYCDFEDDVTFHKLIHERYQIEDEITTLESLLAKVTIIDVDQLSKEKVSFGHRITLVNLKNNKKEILTIGHPMEGYVRDDLLSVFSPLGKELLGKKIGDMITLNLHDEIIEREILHIE